MSPHDPIAQVGYLQQCLSSATRPVGLFLGAGCPMAIRAENGEPLIPGIAGITKVVCECLGKSNSLVTIMENLKADGIEVPSVEDILTHVRGLRAIVGGGQVRGLTADQLDQLDKHICEQIQSVVNKDLPESITPYHRLASWIKAVERDYPVEVFTTNYDLLIEKALEDSSVPYFDGFAGALTPSFDVQAIEEDKLPTRWARLWKLHGSINWHRDNERVLRGVRTGQSPVIHPSHLKYQESRRLPYLVMMDRLRRYLAQPSAVLIICGYSFRDQHVNDVIVQGLQASRTTMAFALLFQSLQDSLDAVALASKQPNLTVLSRDGAVVGTIEGEWAKRDDREISEGRSPALLWSQNSSNDNHEKKQAEFILGNFAELGNFLQGIVGDTQQAGVLHDQ